MTSWLSAPVRPARYPLVAACLVTAAAHVPVTEDHFHEAPYIGALFVALEVAAVFLAGTLVHRDGRRRYLLVAVAGAAAIAGYVVSRAAGLPQTRDDVGNWAEPLGLVSLGAEAVMVVGGLLAAWVPVERALSVPKRAALPGAALLLACGLGLTSVAAAATPAMNTETSAMSTAGSGYWHDVAGAAPTTTGQTRTYFISADEVTWNYTPTGRDGITGRPFDQAAGTWVGAGSGRIGSTYLKCVYRGYTDATFSQRQVRPAEDAYLGLLGPVLHAAVGDTIKVVFRNSCPFPTSVHPHGVFYDKSSEGAPYDDGTPAGDKADDAVPTGGRHTYVWEVPDRAGPGPHDGSSVMWMYHSHTDEVADTYAGLMGPIVVTRAGMARADGSPTDVDREVFAEFFIDNETLSPLFAANVQRFAQPPKPVSGELTDEVVEANLKHTINGYLFGNMPMITVHKGEHVRWYVMSMGTETDLHTPHWHGNDVLVGGMRMDVVSLLPATMVVADMVPDNPGIWLFHCHVNDHLTAGMAKRYQVLP